MIPSSAAAFVAAGMVVAGAVVRAQPARDGSRAARPEPVASPAAFAPTRENGFRPSGSAPDGMVWVPGGEFSMGSQASDDSLCSMPGLTHDAQPIHRVYVDGFWMDATEVTN